jgi:hypothetical protein
MNSFVIHAKTPVAVKAMRNAVIESINPGTLFMRRKIAAQGNKSLPLSSLPTTAHELALV